MTKRLLSALVLAGTQLFCAEMTALQALYDHGDYQNVILEASQDYPHYNDPQLHFLWAKSAEALGDDIAAMSAYERVLLLDSKHTQAQIALVAVYKRLHRGMLSDALYANLFRRESTVATNSRALRLDAKLSLGYDSNIGANSDLQRSDTLRDDVEDTLFARANAQVSYTRHFDAHWFAQATLGAEAQTNSDTPLYNLYDAAASMGMGYRTDDAVFYVPLSYTRMYYLERDFLAQYGTYPYCNIALTPHMTLNLGFKYLQRRFVDPVDRPRNDTVLGSGAGLFYTIERGYVSVKGGYDRYDAQEATPLYFTEKQIFHTDAGIGKTFGDYLFSADYHFQQAYYDDTFQSGSKQEKRTDTYHRIDMKADMLLYEHWHLTLEYGYTKNDSNYRYAPYSKHVIMTGVQYSY